MTSPGAPEWLAGPARPWLPHGEIHLWRGSLSGPDPTYLVATLSEDERLRAGHYHRPGDRDRFIAARGLLRTTIARYVGLSPQDVRFRYGQHGKPALAGTALDEPSFSVAHSGELVLIAVTRGREIGVDVERIRPAGDADGIAAIVFSDRERAVLRSLPAAERSCAFFTGWVRKEACAKVDGEGLAASLWEIETVHGDLTSPLLITLPNRARTRVIVQSLVPRADYVAAVAVEAALGLVPRYHRWTIDDSRPLAE